MTKSKEYKEPEMTVSEDEDSDYEFNEDESNEDEGEDDSCEEDGVEALIDDQEVKFRDLLSRKIEEAEQFFDDASTLQRHLSRSTLTEAQQNACPLCPPLPNNQTQVELLNVDIRPITSVTGMDRQICELVRANCSCNVATQTEENGKTNAQLEGWPTESVAASVEAGCKEGISGADRARNEIAQLRDVRESLITNRQEWAGKLKEEGRSEEELKTAECKVFEIEEAIEAVDLAIEYKNELVLGKPKYKSLMSDSPNDSAEANLVVRLENLSLEELRRLLCSYFGKVVELRSSSRRLEKQLEQAENANELLGRHFVDSQRYWKERHTQCQNRILMMLSCHNPNKTESEYMKAMEAQLEASLKKQHDLQRSLTELLIRHGYLVNGADYDVKQVVKMLGIKDIKHSSSTRAREGDSGARSATVGTAEQVPNSYSRSRQQLRTRRNGRHIDEQDLAWVQHHKDSRHNDGYDRDRDQRHVPQNQHQQMPSEVRRERGRLIIQPGNTAGSSSHYTHHGGLNLQPHHSLQPHHQHHHHRSTHGSSHHGYK